ncbi:ComEA family DNA-binding protein [Zunongwangia sp.]|uniref:ComEA family DNA-binding protein n=1 Tax=Zunongwangia sp. TaxID=1965325 RepID=UPI003AA8E1CB
MKFLKSHFVFNNSERNGIFVLIVLIIIIQILYFFYPFQNTETYSNTSNPEVEKFQKDLDSIHLLQQQKKDTIFPFNPNFLTDYKAYRLGLSLTEIDRLKVFRDKGKWINSAEDFQQVTQISDSLLQLLIPYFKFPDWVRKVVPKKVNSKSKKLDINTATIQDLKKVKGIGDKLSARIIRYRNKLGGFRGAIQFKEIYGLNSETRKRLITKFDVFKTDFQKQNLNTISLIDLAEIPYFDYELAKSVITFRKLHEGIKSFEELSKIDSFPASKIEAIQLYLYIE